MGTSKIPRAILQLGPFQLLVDTRVLLRDGQQVQLAPRAVEVLAVLAAKTNEIVSKDDLMRAVWPDTFVEEVNLAVHISALRKLLAGEGDAIRIETIPKRGYRLRGDVRPAPPNQAEGPCAPAAGDSPLTSAAGQVAGPAPLEVPAPAPREQRIASRSSAPDRLRSRRLQWKATAGIAAVIAFLVAFGVWLDRWTNRLHGGVEAGGARIQSLAVLPLENLSGDPRQDYFAAGITDELTTELAHIHGLRVVSRTSASQFQNAHRSLPDIARTLSVDGVIEGSVVRAGSRVRITTQLIEAATDRHLWAGTYEDSIDGVIALQDRVARDVAREIRAAVKPEGALLPESAAGRPAGVDRQAYDDYLQGLYVWNRRDVRSFDEAIAHFSRAAAEDPHFAPALASLADVYVLYALNGDDPKFPPLARQAALEALAQDPNSAEAHAALAATSAVFGWDWPTAGREFQRAIELDPNYATGHQWYADFYLVPELRFDDAIHEMDAAVALDPLSPIMLVDDGWVWYLRGDYPRAKRQFDRAVEMDPNFVPASFRLEGWYLAQGLDADFARYAARNARIAGGNEVLARAVEEGFAREGMRGAARAELDDARSRGLPFRSAVAAQYLAMLDDTTGACAALLSAVPQHSTSLLYVNVDPRYAPLRHLPCSNEIARQTGLPQLPSPASATASSDPRP